MKICLNGAVLLEIRCLYQFGAEIKNQRSLTKAQHPFLEAEMAFISRKYGNRNFRLPIVMSKAKLSQLRTNRNT